MMCSFKKAGVMSSTSIPSGTISQDAFSKRGVSWKFHWFSAIFATFIGIVLTASFSSVAAAQSATTKGANASSVLSQLSAAFSGSNAVQKIQLSGTAIWYAGSLEDSGTVNLTASSDGSSQMQLLLASLGRKTETQTGAGSGAACQWSGADGVAHQLDLGNCWRPTLWFLPALTLHPSMLSNQISLVDLGSGTVGTSANVYRHLQGQLVPSGLPANLASEISKRSTTDIGLDPATLLPAVLAYSVHPDNGAPLTIAMEIHYSDYRAVNRAQIPFHIERYVNGSLQLDIHVSSAEIN